MKSVYEKIGLGIVALILGSLMFYVISIYAIMANGYVGYIMWGWFAPEIIKGQITSMWDFIFVLMTVKIFIHNRNADNDTEKNNYKKILYPLLFPWTWLLLGWVVKNKFWLF